MWDATIGLLAICDPTATKIWVGLTPIQRECLLEEVLSRATAKAVVEHTIAIKGLDDTLDWCVGGILACATITTTATATTTGCRTLAPIKSLIC